jgi:hypothetical protein
MNKPRLIDANELIGCINEWYESCSPRTDLRDMVICDTLDSVLQHIDDIPTAYDIDKVVERLEEERDRPFTDCSLTINGIPANDKEIIACKVGINYAIEIVKGGAVDDETMA